MTLSSLRGKDSTGVAVIHDGKTKPRTLKGVGGPDLLFCSDAWDKITEFAEKKGKAIFGHNRWATKGAVNAKNAHPFTHEHITLVHNGTIHYGVEDGMKDVESDVDSYGLCVEIAKNGIMETLRGIVGAYALIVHDSKENCVYVSRNRDRPLHRLCLWDRDIIMSEEGALQYLATKGGVHNPRIEYFSPFDIWKLDLETNTWTVDKTLAEEEAALKNKYAPPVVSQMDGSGASGKIIKVYAKLRLLCIGVVDVDSKTYRYEFLDEDRNEIFYSISSKFDESKVGEVCTVDTYNRANNNGKDLLAVKFRDLVWENPTAEYVQFLNGSYLKTSEWESRIIKQECVICGGDVRKGDHKETILTTDKNFICKDCIKEGKHRQYGFDQ